jgi:hypothetical protein
MQVKRNQDMTDDRRALLTPDERDILTGEKTVSDNHKYTVVSRVRKKIQKLDDDMTALEEYSDGLLLDELRDVVCDGTDTKAVDPTPPTDQDTGTTSDGTPDTETDETPSDAVERVASDWSEDGRKEARKEAARAVLDYAREHGGVSKKEAKEEVYPEHKVEGQNARTWYRLNVRPVLNEVATYSQARRKYELDE